MKIKAKDNRLIEEFSTYVKKVKKAFDIFDQTNRDRKKQIAFLEKKRAGIFKRFDSYFFKLWHIISNLENIKKETYLKKYNSTFKYMFGKSIKINQHIYRKPFGYSGDYITMNYIFDYSGDKYLGKTSFQRLINNYTCSIPFAKSNITRKNFIKNKIKNLVKRRKRTRILSVGSGPMRELTELIEEGGLKNYTEVVCLDLEKRAIHYTKNKIKKMDISKTNLLKVNYIQKDILELLRMDFNWKNFDFVYASGLFDYLRDSICKNLTYALYNLLSKGGFLLICNASSYNVTHRAYYEFLGRWVMLYRKKGDMLAWLKEIQPKPSVVKFEEPSNFTNYLFLSVTK